LEASGTCARALSGFCSSLFRFTHTVSAVQYSTTTAVHSDLRATDDTAVPHRTPHGNTHTTVALHHTTHATQTTHGHSLQSASATAGDLPLRATAPAQAAVHHRWRAVYPASLRTSGHCRYRNAFQELTTLTPTSAACTRALLRAGILPAVVRRFCGYGWFYAPYPVPPVRLCTPGRRYHYFLPPGVYALWFPALSACDGTCDWWTLVTYGYSPSAFPYVREDVWLLPLAVPVRWLGPVSAYCRGSPLLPGAALRVTQRSADLLLPCYFASPSLMRLVDSAFCTTFRISDLLVADVLGQTLPCAVTYTLAQSFGELHCYHKPLPGSF